METGDFVRCAQRSLPMTPDIRVQMTGEFRCPKKGEWFISGAIPEGYKAYADLTTPYYIGQLTRVKTVTVVKEVRS